MTLTVEDGLTEFYRLLPDWVNERHKPIIAIAFASGAYIAATMAATDPDETLEQARTLCTRLQEAVDDLGEVH